VNPPITLALTVDAIKQPPIDDNVHGRRYHVTAHNYYGESFAILLEPEFVDVNNTTIRVERLSDENGKVTVKFPRVNSQGHDSEPVERRQLQSWTKSKGRIEL